MVGAAVVGAAVVGAAVVGATVVGEAVVGAAVVGASVVGEAVVGAAVVGASVVGESVVGTAVVGAAVVGAAVVGESVVGAAVVGAAVVGAAVAVPVSGDVLVAVLEAVRDGLPTGPGKTMGPHPVRAAVAAMQAIVIDFFLMLLVRSWTSRLFIASGLLIGSLPRRGRSPSAKDPNGTLI